MKTIKKLALKRESVRVLNVRSAIKTGQASDGNPPPAPPLTSTMLSGGGGVVQDPDGGPADPPVNVHTASCHYAHSF